MFLLRIRFPLLKVLRFSRTIRLSFENIYTRNATTRLGLPSTNSCLRYVLQLVSSPYLSKLHHLIVDYVPLCYITRLCPGIPSWFSEFFFFSFINVSRNQSVEETESSIHCQCKSRLGSDDPFRLTQVKTVDDQF